MAIEEFGVCVTAIRDEYFTWLDAFSATTSPSDSTVERIITQQAAILAGRLLLEGIAAATVAADDESPGYVMCGDIISKMAAVAIAQNMTGMNSELLKTWRADVDAWFEGLNAGGGAYLGNAALATGSAPADGPTTHINHFNLSTSVGTTPSSIDPIFTRDDKL